jgi:hypothetical protein
LVFKESQDLQEYDKSFYLVALTLHVCLHSACKKPAMLLQDNASSENPSMPADFTIEFEPS